MMTVELLQAPFVKPWNEDYAGHVLATRLYVQLPMKHHMGAFLVSPDYATLVIVTPGPVHLI